ncbi:MAG TPA: histidine phosphatase family protein [Planctomicrobium sp.]|nr:histidine phosphatase family protein [Planctomicrobium sp.]
MPTTGSTRLLLMRHAKSDWSHEGLTDHDRPLNDRGRRDAPRMAQLLQEQNLIPDLVVSSSAERARETAQLVTGELNGSTPVIERGLYLASAETWLSHLKAYDFQTLTLCIGHNPGLEELIARLTGTCTTMTTAAIALLQRQDNTDLNEEGRKSSWKLVQIWRPKEL